jgi:hypothetical protein
MRRADVVEWDEFDRPAGERSSEELKRIVRYQRWLIGLVLAQLALWMWWGVLEVAGAGRGPHDAARLLLGAVVLAAGAFVFMLECTLNGVAAGLFGGLLALIPGLGLLFQVMANQAATTDLKKHGLTVGTFGASPAEVDVCRCPYDIDEDAGW